MALDLRFRVHLSAPNESFPPLPGQAQVIFSCDYESASAQWSTSSANRQNPPGEHRGRNTGDILAPGTYHHTAKAFGSHGKGYNAPDFYADTYTLDSWPEQKVVTSYRVPRRSMTRANVIEARNEYAKGCAFEGYTADPRLVSVNVYSPWALTF